MGFRKLGAVVLSWPSRKATCRTPVRRSSRQCRSTR